MAVLIVGGFIAYPFVIGMLPMGTGSLEYAREWSARLRKVDSVAQAQREYPSSRSRTFANGDWIVVVSDNSHGNPWGGTVVTRDSHGVIRTLYGHVCLRADLGRESKSLDDVYRALDRAYSDKPGGRQVQRAH